MSAVMFDLGNVLVRLRFDRGLARLAAMGGRCGAILGSALKRDFDSGRIDTEGFLRALDVCGAPRAQVVEAWCDVFDRWPEMEAVLEEVLASGRKTYLMSNTDPLHLAHLQAVVPALSRVHGAQLSYACGHLKPDAEFFLGALRQWGLRAEECVFIDDLADNVAAAEALGIRAHLHTGDVPAVRRALGLSD